MRILIVSDTHRADENFCTVVERVGKLDLVIHCGDAEGSEQYLSEVAGCSFVAIAGNNDFFTTLPKERELTLGRYKILVTHGHYYYVSVEMERIRQEGRERGVDIVMFGHTHRPLIDVRDDDVSLINPGSLSYPRQEGRRPSYILMDVDEQGEAKFTLKYV